MSKKTANKPTIFLDLDGVCCDLFGSAAKLHGRDPVAARAYTMQEGDGWLPEFWGISQEAFWKPIDKAGVDFWRKLPELPWFREMHERLQRLGHVVFLTSPARSPFAASGKAQWLRDRFGWDFEDFVLTRQKHLLARPEGVVLIDDTRGQTDAFKKAGGRAVLFPATWNGRKPLDPETLPAIIAAEVHCTLNSPRDEGEA